MVKRALDVRQLRELPLPERLKLIEELWDSVAAEAPDLAIPMTPELADELERRLAEHDADPSSAIPWERVRDELLRDRRQRPK